MYNSWGTRTPNFSLNAFLVSSLRCMLWVSRKAIQKSFRSFFAAPRTVRYRKNNVPGRPPNHSPATREHHPFRLFSTQGSCNCDTRTGGGYAGGTPKSACSCRRPWLWGQGGRGRRRSSNGRRYDFSRRWHAAAAEAATTLVPGRWYTAATTAATTLVSRRWHAASTAATVAMVSRR